MMKAHRYLFLGLLSFTGGCVSHISPYEAKKREFDRGDYANAVPQGANSLYAQGARGLYEDDRARAVGDVVFIQLDENSSAEQDGASKLSKNGSMSVGLTGGLVTALQKAIPAVQLAQLLGTNSASALDGSGTITKKGTLSGMLPVRVRRVLPNTDLYVEGTKVVMVGAEEHHLYISGILRMIDIHNDGTISSSRVADAEIEYTGRGDITDHTSPGWLHRIINKVNPL